VYGAVLAAFQPDFSLWPVAVAQVVLALLVMAEFARVVLPGLSPRQFFLQVVVLTVATDLPWSAPEVMPDVFAPVLVLSLYLLGFHSAALSLPRKAALAAVAVLAATSHASHLGLAAGLAAVTVLAQLLPWRAPQAAARPRWGLPALVFALSLALVMVSNAVRTGEVFVSRAGPSFIMARLLQDGIAQRVLNDTCPASGYELCAYRHQLPHDSNDFLWQWNSPFWKLGGFNGMADEAQDIIEDSLERYPLLSLKAAAGNTARQFVTFRTGDGVEPLDGVPEAAIRRGMPNQLDDYQEARQQSGEIDFRVINAFQVPLGGLATIALAGILVRAARERWRDDRLYLPAFVLVSLLGNAFICGALSSPHDRYQSRLIWAAVFAVILLTGRLRNQQTDVGA
ncbi:MAG TPA: hypothetical protein VH722_20490, partial [Alphaproteobacteria bacterium]|nr:hypothetical protein [Alphaproteobacteria bacterium]